MADMYSSVYNPDVLSCLANLSNDEVFTPPAVVNAMLDMLPQELFQDKNTTFLEKTFSTLIQPVVIFGNGRKWTHFSDSFENGRIWAQ